MNLVEMRKRAEKAPDFASYEDATDLAHDAIEITPKLKADVLTLIAEVERLRGDPDGENADLVQRAHQALHDAGMSPAPMADRIRSLAAQRDDARAKVGTLLHEIARVAIAAGMMREDAPPLDGPNAILFLQQMRERFLVANGVF